MFNNYFFILVDDFESLTVLVDFIKKLDENDKEYVRYLEFKDEGVINERFFNFMKNRFWGISFEE